MLHRAQEFGISVSELRGRLAQAIRRSRGSPTVWRRVSSSCSARTRSRSSLAGALAGRGTVQVKGKDGERTLEARALVLGTGSEPKSLPGVAIDEKRVISSNGAVRNEAKPGSLIIIGAGAVGMEFADVYATYGVQVTVLEALPRVLPLEDEEASTQIGRLFTRRGIAVRTGVKVQSVKADADGVAVEVETEGKVESLRADQVLMAVVARPGPKG